MFRVLCETWDSTAPTLLGLEIRQLVTSDLASHIESAHHGQGGGSIEVLRASAHKSFAFKIMTSKPFAIKTLQNVFRER
jgi:hypothetical protein